MILRTTLAAILLAALPLPAQSRATAEATLPGGKVTLDYLTGNLQGRSAEKDLQPGTVWRMAVGGEAPLLRTEVPLMVGGVVLPPGAHRLSARYVGPDTWHLVVFRGAALHESGMKADETPFQFSKSGKAEEQLKISLAAKDQNLEVQVAWGESALRANLTGLGVSKVESTLAGKPAVYEFFQVPATPDTQERLKAGQEVRVGAVRTKDGGELAIVGQREERGVKLVFRNDALKEAQAEIASATAMRNRLEGMLEQAPEERRERLKGRIDQLARQVEAAQKRLAAAQGLPAEVAVAGKVEMREERSTGLLVRPLDAKAGVSLAMDFGQRSATFQWSDADFSTTPAGKDAGKAGKTEKSEKPEKTDK